MPAYFICPKCQQNNYGQKTAPKEDFVGNLRCTRCGLTQIYWVRTKEIAKALETQLKVSTDKIAIGVFDSSIEWMEPEVAPKRDEGILKRLEPFASLKAPYSQGQRTKAFSPGTKAIQEGVCEGQCLHWIRRVLQGGTEDYKASDKVSDEEVLLKQKRQHTVGAVAQLLSAQVVDRQQKAITAHEAARAAESAALKDLQLQQSRVREKFDAALLNMGFVNEGGNWKLGKGTKKDWNDAWTKWDAIEAAFRAKAETISGELKVKAAAAAQAVGAVEKQSLYGDGWQELARKLDSWVDQKVRVTKRRFSNILSVKNVDRLAFQSAASFANALIQDREFCPGTCALLSIGLSRGVGESGGSIPSHAIAAHFKEVQEIYLFDPNLGIFMAESIHQFRGTLETMIGKVWPTDFKWELDGEFGYSLFRKRNDGRQTNTAERSVAYYPSPGYTATKAKADGVTPRATGGGSH